jgi:lipopolysaccharide export system permease protein
MGLYLIVDFFDRIDNLLKADAPLWTSIRYFLYKLPLLMTHVFGFATLFATLFSIGMLTRSHEITAMRSGGFSLHRISLPLLILSLWIGLFAFFWNEALVPIFTRQAQYIYKTEVKKKQPKSLIGTRNIWIRGDASFIRVDHFDAKQTVLEGISIFMLNRDFSLKGLIEVPSARWTNSRWEATGGSEWIFLPDGKMSQRKIKTSLPLSQTPEDFQLLIRKPEEYSFFDLRRHIADLKEKGIDATESEVDLQIKLALPLVSPLMIFLAIPFALKHGQGGGIALSFGLSMLIGFFYWIVLAFSVSLGHNGALPPWIAAWLPNLTLAMGGLFFFMGEE